MGRRVARPHRRNRFEAAFAGIPFTQPVAIKQRPGLPLRYFVVEQTGLVKTFQTGDTKAEVALDLTSVVYAGFGQVSCS